MDEKEKKLLAAAKGITQDFESYGEVTLQHDINGEYDTTSAIGMLIAAVNEYK